MATIEQSAIVPAPGTPGSPVAVAERYGNFIGGRFGIPIDGRVP